MANFTSVLRRHVILTTGILVLLAHVSSASTSSQSNKESEKDKARHVTVEVLNATSVTLRWDQPKGTDRFACPVQRYMIRLKQEGIKQSRAWRFDGARQSVSLHDLQPRTNYQVRLVTITCDGKRKPSRWVKVTTSDVQQQNVQFEEKQAPGQPTSVRTRTFSDSVLVTWYPPEDNTVVRGYMIGYGEGVPDVMWRYVTAEQRNFTIKNLKAATQYVISVRALNNFGKGQVVYDIAFTRDVTSSMSIGNLPPPTHLKSKILSATSTWLQWTDPSLDGQQRITDERYYNVYYQALPHGKNLSVIVKALQVTLYDLVANKQYRFKVRTVKGAQTSEFSDSIINRTFEAGNIDSRSPSRTNTSASTDAAVRPSNRTSGSVEELEEYDYEEDLRESTGNINILQTGSRTDDTLNDGKTKRAPNPRNQHIVREALARTLSDPELNATAAPEIKVSFRSMVQYRVSAYVTWPERMTSQGCSVTSQPEVPQPSVAGYIFRYKTVDDAGEYIARNLASNFVLVENLLPNAKYKYQVKYIMEKGSVSGWSQETLLDTSYRP